MRGRAEESGCQSDRRGKGCSDDTDDDVIIEAEPEFQSHAEQSGGSTPQGCAPVVNNNPIFIQQNGDGNMVIPNYGTITINKK